jgi:hypothetical protein
LKKAQSDEKQRKTSAIDYRGYRSSFDVILFSMVKSLASHDRHVV